MRTRQALRYQDAEPIIDVHRKRKIPGSSDSMLIPEPAVDEQARSQAVLLEPEQQRRGARQRRALEVLQAWKREQIARLLQTAKPPTSPTKNMSMDLHQRQQKANLRSQSVNSIPHFTALAFATRHASAFLVIRTRTV